MPVIVFEGPDSSGKTTFALALKAQLQASRALGELEVEYQRSPVKQHGWSDTYDHYLYDLANVSRDRLIIQDRVPEISEPVYGTLRGSPRGRGWAVDLYQWLQQDILFIYCKGNPRYLEGLHEDALGNKIQDEEHRRINLLYELTFFNIHRTMLWAHPHNFQAIYYDRHITGDWIHLFRDIAGWLARLVPEQAIELALALTFSHDSAFPFHEEFSE